MGTLPSVYTNIRKLSFSSKRVCVQRDSLRNHNDVLIVQQQGDLGGASPFPTPPQPGRHRSSRWLGHFSLPPSLSRRSFRADSSRRSVPSNGEHGSGSTSTGSMSRRATGWGRCPWRRRQRQDAVEAAGAVVTQGAWLGDWDL